MIAATMKAVIAAQAGGPESLTLVDRPVPSPGPGEILVKVAAAGINRPDILQRKGLYPPPHGTPDTLGLEIAGHVVALGEGTCRFREGDAVMALLPGGGYAEYATVFEGTALPIPAGVSLIEAAAIPETYFTVWSNVFERGKLKAGEVFLVHGGTSGIGTTAIQLAKVFGAFVVATAATAEKCAACRKLGADIAINYREEDFVKAVKERAPGNGADVILDMVGGTYIARNYEAARQDGRIVQIALLEGSKAEIDFSRLMLKRLTHTGSTLRSRPASDKAKIADALQEKIFPLLARGFCKPVIDTTFPLAEAVKAHERMETSAHIGKIVLKV